MSMPLNEFDDAVQTSIDSWQEELASADAEILKLQEKLYQPLYEKRDAIVNKVEDFWPTALQNCDGLSQFCDDIDAPLLAALKHIKVSRDAKDPRGAKIEFAFNDNEYLKENTLVKRFVVRSDAVPLGSADFDWETDLEPLRTEIQWKSDEVNLCKKAPTLDPKDDDEAFEPGSFFSSFFDSTQPSIAGGIGQIIAETFYPQAIEWYTGEAIGSMEGFDFDSEDEDDDSLEEEDDDDDEAEIDLEQEKPAAKKQKRTA